MNTLESSRRIAHLSPATQSRLRSTQILVSLSQIISELVQNSLDAGAQHIDIGVDCEDWGCWVRDDGFGIGRNGLAVLAGGAESGRYSTSKAYSPASLGEVSTFGFRGEALASAADLSCLEISSRTARSRESWSVILKGGATLYSGPSVRWRRESPGTVVSVRDAFYNLPIRRLSHLSPSRTLELIRKDVEAFALVFPQVVFSLENAHKTKEGGCDKGRVMTVPKTASTLSTFRHLYGRALAQHVEEIDEALGDMKLRGFISLEGAYSKAYQFLYINHHLLSTCDLHRVIDHEFSRSSFMKHAYDEAGETGLPRSKTRRSPRKTEKRPVYVLDLIVPQRDVDNCLEPAKSAVHLQNSEAVSRFLGSIIEAFLLRHGFLTRASASTVTPSPSPRKRRKLIPQEDVTTADRMRPGSSRNPSARPASPPLIIRPGSEVQVDGTDPRAEIVWTDPTTGESFVVDTRTGNSYPLNAQISSSSTQSDVPGRPSGRRTLGVCESRTNGTKDETAPVPEWIRDALGANETYVLTEPVISALDLSSTFADTMTRPHLHPHACRPSSDGTFPSLREGATYPGRISKAGLHAATVLGQVDRKFIACVIGDDGEVESTSGRALVLIDQHAADERIRVERFLQDLCLGFLHHKSAPEDDDHSGVRTRMLEPPLPVLLTRHEAVMLTEREGVRTAFRRWGVDFVGLHDLHMLEVRERAELGPRKEADEMEGGRPGYVQVMVASIPEVVGDKLLAGEELRDFVKGYLAKLETEGTPAMPSIQPSASAENSEFLWQRALRWCPHALLELINSKACRGAIMFNDTLTLEQCMRLVHQLAETALPFQCAHGRPSLVPLADIGRETHTNHPSGLCSDSVARLKAVDWPSFTRTRRI
ncbi:hypothetical protein SCP_0211000 [Sparassis crispa]|uniref:MutL C-terminal dimerisation domain-containing protein n=1 Tax=Sparassis crispa TaxID=139825 RepID=A0A401GCI4_9APHY|nr:hypothetical protein SCP_0211000 [Sparassis crispa]GBE79898.1 hypothetical protein SCP_0211000 [Sparassis crispa]